MYSVIPLSGGLDSSIVLLHTVGGIAAQCSGNCNNWPTDRVACVSFDYGQRNVVELEYARRMVRWVNRTYRIPHPVRHVVLDVADAVRTVAPCTMTKGRAKFNYDTLHAPTSFVPGRNALFLSLALSFAVTSRRDFKDRSHTQVIMGFNRSDIGMPDTTWDFARSFRDAWCKGLPDNERPPLIAAPFREDNKVEMFRRAQTFHANCTTDAAIRQRLIRGTLSCHYGVETLHEWGRGCGTCAPCEWRKGIR